MYLVVAKQLSNSCCLWLESWLVDHPSSLKSDNQKSPQFAAAWNSSHNEDDIEMQCNVWAGCCPVLLLPLPAAEDGLCGIRTLSPATPGIPARPPPMNEQIITSFSFIVIVRMKGWNHHQDSFMEDFLPDSELKIIIYNIFLKILFCTGLVI